MDDNISPSHGYPDERACLAQGPKTAPRPKDKKPEETKSWGSLCHDFPMILLMRFGSLSQSVTLHTFHYVHFCFYTFSMFLSVHRFHVGLQVSLISGPSGGPNLQVHHLSLELPNQSCRHVTRMFNIDKKITGCTVTCACALYHC